MNQPGILPLSGQLQLFSEIYGAQIDLDGSDCKLNTILHVLSQDKGAAERFREYSWNGELKTTKDNPSARQRHIEAIADALSAQQRFELLGSATTTDDAVVSSHLRRVVSGGSGGAPALVYAPEMLSFEQALLVEVVLLRDEGLGVQPRAIDFIRGGVSLTAGSRLEGRLSQQFGGVMVDPVFALTGQHGFIVYYRVEHAKRMYLADVTHGLVHGPYDFSTAPASEVVLASFPELYTAGMRVTTILSKIGDSCVLAGPTPPNPTLPPTAPLPLLPPGGPSPGPLPTGPGWWVPGPTPNVPPPPPAYACRQVVLGGGVVNCICTSTQNYWRPVLRCSLWDTICWSSTQ
ncbi:MAG: hypothetical protein ACK4WH_04495, partial [Phycisphaerales bacterium]